MVLYDVGCALALIFIDPSFELSYGQKLILSAWCRPLGSLPVIALRAYWSRGDYRETGGACFEFIGEFRFLKCYFLSISFQYTQIETSRLSLSKEVESVD